MAFKGAGGDGALRLVPGGDSIPLISSTRNNSRQVRRLLFFVRIQPLIRQKHKSEFFNHELNLD